MSAEVRPLVARVFVTMPKKPNGATSKNAVLAPALKAVA